MTTLSPLAWRPLLSPHEIEIIRQVQNEITDEIGNLDKTEDKYSEVQDCSLMFCGTEELNANVNTRINTSSKDFDILGFQTQIFIASIKTVEEYEKLIAVMIEFLMDKFKDRIIKAECSYQGLDYMYINIQYKIKKIFDYEYNILDKLIIVLKNTKCVDGLELNMWESDLVMFDENFFILDKSYLSLVIRNKDLNSFQAKMLKNILTTIENTLDFYGFKLVKSENKDNTDAWMYYSIILADDLIINAKDVVAEIYKDK